ncbi:MAG: discoidin domain-containing protein [Bacteroidota bacterium]
MPDTLQKDKKSAILLFKKFRWVAPSLLLLFGFTATLLPPPGLDQAEAIGPYLNGNFPSTAPEGDIIAEEIYTALDWESPIVAIPFPFTNDLLVIEMDGRFYTIDDNDFAASRTLVMDIQDRAWYYNWSGTVNRHGGIQNAAFHPDFGQGLGKDYLYVYYVFKATNESTNYSAPYYDRLSRFTWNGTQFDPNSEVIMINQYDTSKGHDGSGMAFGNDGFLYVAIGDEGTQNASATIHTQKIDDRFRSGVWRIDVDKQGGTISHPIIRQPLNNAPAGSTPSYTQEYYIPNDNPWVDPSGGTLEEFYAVGLRQPFRMTYDAPSGNFWIGDVGSGQKEEIDLLDQPGLNFQWNYMEGTSNGYSTIPSALIGTDRAPIYDYGRSDGTCVIGGYVYRGTDIPSLIGKYIFADNGNGKIRALDHSIGNNHNGVEDLLSVGGSLFNGVSSFGQRHDNELLVLRLGKSVSGAGKIFKLTTAPVNNAPGTALPLTLSATGIFTDLANLTTAPGIIPYDVNTPLWSAGTSKKRWVAIPNDGTIDSPAEQITYSEEGNWAFPAGTVFIKHFGKPDGQKLETRVMVHGVDGAWYGHTYKWRADGSDADILLEGGTESITIDGENFVYAYPGTGECVTCHNENAGSVLGFKTRQLNRDTYYPSTGRTANQLETLFGLNFIPFANTANVLTSVPIGNNKAELEIRARSYLDANCAHCHQPGNNRSVFDARLSTDLLDQELIHGEVHDDLGITGMEVIRPRFTEQSSVYHRMNTMESGVSMPQLAKGRIDREAVQLMANWINAMDANCATNASLVLGNPTVDGNFVDGHSPAVIINKTDSYENTSSVAKEICVANFSFYARRVTSPVTPFLAKEVGTNDFIILAIGETRTASEYVVGSNSFNFSDQGSTVIKLEAGEKLLTGFAYTHADGSPSTNLSVIPAQNASGQDAVWQTYYTSNGVYPGIYLGKAPKLASGVAANLSRSYSFSIGINVADWPQNIDNDDNIAYLKPATQSSMGWGGLAERAVDGNTNSIYNQGSITHTQASTNPWWRVDLGDTYNIDQINVFNRTDCCIDRMIGAKVMVGDIDSSDPADYTEIGILNSDPQQNLSGLTASGRYIMLYQPGTNKILSIAELQAFGELAPVLENLALQKAATQSSMGWGGLAERAVDGNTSGIYSQGSITHTTISDNPWWRVDLGDNYLLSQIDVFNRTDACCAERLVGAKVLVGLTDSNDPADYTEIGVLNSDATQNFNGIAALGRYVMVYLPGTNKVLSIAELAAYGQLFDNPGLVAFTDCNYGGPSFTLAPGEYATAPIGGFTNDAISSFLVADGYEVEVFQHYNFQGISEIFTADEACLIGNPLNENISGFKIRPIIPATVYSDCNFTGEAFNLAEGEYPNTLSGDFTNDVISSIKVAEGYEVEVFQHFSYNGISQVFTEDAYCLAGNPLDENISGLKIRKVDNASIQAFVIHEQNKQVLLNWSIADMNEDLELSIERSIDGKAYKVIGLINTYESMQTGPDFAFLDEGAEKFAGEAVSYRIKMAVLNSSSGYKLSNAKQVLIPDDEVLNLLAYPNPVSNLLEVDYYVSDFQALELQVFTSMGQIMYKRQIDNPRGNLKIQTANWPAGVYYVRLQNEIDYRVVKISKL